MRANAHHNPSDVDASAVNGSQENTSPIDLPDKRAILELAVATMDCSAAIISTVVEGTHHVLAAVGDDAARVNDAQLLAEQVGKKEDRVVVRKDGPVGALNIGIPLRIPGSTSPGVLSIIDKVPRRLTAEDRRALNNLQTIINTLLATHDAHRAAAERQAELHVTLENMDQGVTVFDANARLTLWNQRYLEIFEKDPKEVFKGVSLRDLIKTQNGQDGFEGLGDNYDAMLAELRAGLKRNEIVQGGVRLNSGRVISSVHAAMPNGGWVATHSDITERVHAQEKIEYASQHDGMTGLVNREKFSKDFERHNEGRGKLLIMLIDIDLFKSINDNYGHGAGDAVIMSVAERLQDCVRGSDVVARLGGDEFAVLMRMSERVDSATVQSIAAQIVKRMGDELTFHGNNIKFSVSVGCHQVEAGQSDLEEALSCADFALYKAKEDGRSRYQFFDQETATQLLRSKRMQALLHQDTYAEKLQLHYQPLVDLKSGRDFGFEALIRWAGDCSEHMTPTDIIQAAEQTGSIGSLGEWVLNRAFEQSKDWEDGLRIAVNVSPKQLGQGDCLEQIKAALERWHVSPKRLEIEVTETAILQDQASIDELHQIKALGVRIALDDFGTGFSSLTLLKRFPFDKLKIDRSFVGNVDTDPMSHAIVRSVAQLGRDLGLTTVAEGIETEQQLTLMKSLGCGLGQGYYLGKPMAHGEVLARSSKMHSAA